MRYTIIAQSARRIEVRHINGINGDRHLGNYDCMISLKRAKTDIKFFSRMHNKLYKLLQKVYGWLRQRVAEKRHPSAEQVPMS